MSSAASLLVKEQQQQQQQQQPQTSTTPPTPTGTGTDTPNSRLSSTTTATTTTENPVPEEQIEDLIDDNDTKDNNKDSGLETPPRNTSKPQVQSNPLPPAKEEDSSHSSNNNNKKKNSSAQAGSSAARHRRSKRVLEQDPIIAPGYGTRKDLVRLTRELGGSLPLEAVEAVMKSRGRGIRSSNRNSTTPTNTTTANSNDAASADTSMWADFMQQEGVDTATATTTTASSTNIMTGTAATDTPPASKKQKTTPGRASRSAKREEEDSKATTSAGDAAGAADHDDDDDDDNYEEDTNKPRQYSLPSEWEEFETSTGNTATKKKKAKGGNSVVSGGGSVAGASAGALLQAGTLDANIVGRNKSKLAEQVYHCSLPTQILSGIKIAQVFTSCNAVHSFALAADGVTTYAWGRNESSQLGLGPAQPKCVFSPTALETLPAPVRQVAVGKSHSVFLLQDKTLFAVGANKVGQCGVKNFADVIPQVRKCVLPEGVVIAQISCGEDFTTAVSTVGHLYSCGSSQYGQLGNGETGEYFVSANKLAFANASVLERRAVFCHLPNEKLHTNSGGGGGDSDKDKVIPLPDSDSILIQQVACGKHHTIAVEATSSVQPTTTNRRERPPQRPRVFSFGCGDYGCLGHGVQRDEYFPRMIGVIDKLPMVTTASSSSVAAGGGGAAPFVAALGAHCSLLRTTANGHVYYWGKHRSVGEAVMRPQLVDALANNQHFVSHVAAGAQTVICSTSLAQTVVWGQGPHGELGLGGKAKSSSKPTFVEALDTLPVLDVAAGYGHTLFVVDDNNDNAALEKLPQVDEDDVEPLVEAAST